MPRHYDPEGSTPRRTLLEIQLRQLGELLEEPWPIYSTPSGIPMQGVRVQQNLGIQAADLELLYQRISDELEQVDS
jgi:hypothetical protein